MCNFIVTSYCPEAYFLCIYSDNAIRCFFRLKLYIFYRPTAVLKAVTVRGAEHVLLCCWTVVVPKDLKPAFNK